MHSKDTFLQICSDEEINFYLRWPEGKYIFILIFWWTIALINPVESILISWWLKDLIIVHIDI